MRSFITHVRQVTTMWGGIVHFLQLWNWHLSYINDSFGYRDTRRFGEKTKDLDSKLMLRCVAARTRDGAGFQRQKSMDLHSEHVPWARVKFLLFLMEYRFTPRITTSGTTSDRRLRAVVQSKYSARAILGDAWRTRGASAVCARGVRGVRALRGQVSA